MKTAGAGAGTAAGAPEPVPALAAAGAAGGASSPSGQAAPAAASPAAGVAAAAKGANGGPDSYWELCPGFWEHGPMQYIYFYQKPNTVSVIMYRDKSGDPEEWSISGSITGFVEVPSAEQLTAQLRQHHPHLPEAWVDAMAAQTCAETGPGYSLSKIVRVSQLHGPACVLVGDAGHSVTSALGQGCNAALESAQRLGAVLDSVRGDLTKLPGVYTAARLPEVHALQTLEHTYSLMMCTVGISAWARLCARLAAMPSIILSVALHKLAPAKFPAIPYVWHSLQDCSISYNEVLRTMRMHAALVYSVAAALAVALYKLVTLAWKAVQGTGAAVV
uniref:FAD-binding domain-containing protein n=1 Tax=Chlamydomonas leiostraca TaxID=1034604 RepID=A0A7S0WXR5_9CHLO